MTAVMYVQADGTALYAVSPNPPTPEAVARAQFVDKTYVWKEVNKKAQLLELTDLIVTNLFIVAGVIRHWNDAYL
jgi:hypothetical protein